MQAYLYKYGIWKNSQYLLSSYYNNYNIIIIINYNYNIIIILLNNKQNVALILTIIRDNTQWAIFFKINDIMINTEVYCNCIQHH